ncbi:hypothetical protein HPB52_016329 [Rhipicephalus sanguineus]|uniref:Peptidase M13 N-terminal domain-containing protein n=1 Tax=Rhipicephalus sanguineus TaxID=34632 RepID=A0A9D4QA35_RHISA|nr:hypothetical protein HPB52_016329 [Rhipicephalus sanguineus]
MSSKRRASRDSGRRRASLAGDVRDKERGLAAPASVCRAGENVDLPSAVSKRTSAEKSGTHRDRKNRSRRRSRRNSTAHSIPSVVSDSGTSAASDAEPGGTAQRGATDQVGSVEQTEPRKRTSVTEHGPAMEQPGPAKDPGETQHAGVKEYPGESGHGSPMEQPAQTEHAIRKEHPGATAPNFSTIQPATSQHVGAMVQTDKTEPGSTVDTELALIEEQLDRGVGACDDFYAHVCNRWKPKKEFSDLSRSALSDMVMQWLSYLPTTLSKGTALLPVGRKAAAMFNSCMTETGSHVDILKKFMNAHGLVWPEEPDENRLPADALLDLSFNWNVHLWFTLNILPGFEQSERRRIFMKPNNLMPLWKAVLKQIPKPYYRNVYTVLFKMFANSTQSLPDDNQITAVYNTLQQVFDTLVPPCPCKPRVPGLFTMKDIDKVSPVPVAQYLQDKSNLVLGVKPPITSDDMLLLSDLSLLTRVIGLIGTLNDRDIVRHLSWLFVQAYAAVADPAAVLLLLHGSKQHAEHQRPLFCAIQVEASYELLVAALASAAYFSQEQRRDIDRHLAAILELKNVRTILWPSEKFLEPTELEDAYKNFTESATSFPEYWIETRRSQRALFGTDAAAEELLISGSKTLPYARYTHVLNQLSLPLGAVAPPLYHAGGTKAMLHGGLLYLYAQALVGAVDSDGVKVDPQGNIGPSWLAETSRKAFEQRTLECLPNDGNIFAEIPAMEVAYAAFKRQQRSNDTQLSEASIFLL